MPNKEPDNWWPGIQKQEPFRRGVVIDDPKNLLPRKGKEACIVCKGTRSEDRCTHTVEPQPALPMDVGYLKPQLCPGCRGLGRLKKGRVCRECQGKGVIPAEPTEGG